MNTSKRLFDIVCAGVGLLLLSPVFVGISLMVAVCDGLPIFFKQKRVGQYGHVFYIYKFRTMIADAEHKGHRITVGRDPRITRTGHWLRRHKIDELPQLWNVFKGEMSLVGPRPEVPNYVALYTEEQRRVLCLRPGVTDPASIKYRDESSVLASSDNPELTYIDRILQDKIGVTLRYSDTATLRTDIIVILATVLGRPSLVDRWTLEREGLLPSRDSLTFVDQNEELNMPS